MSLQTQLGTGHGPRRNATVLALACSCRARRRGAEHTPWLPANGVLAAQNKRVVVGYRRWCGSCTTTPLNVEITGRLVTFNYRQTLEPEQVTEIRAAVQTAYGNDATYGVMSHPVQLSDSHLHRSVMSAHKLTERADNAKYLLEQHLRDASHQQLYWDQLRIQQGIVAETPVQTYAEVSAVLKALKKRKVIKAFGILGNNLAISCPGPQVGISGCGAHKPGVFQLPAFLVSGALGSWPPSGVRRITTLGGGAYPHPHARTLCLVEPTKEGINIVNSMGLDNAQSFEVYWSRDISRCIMLLYDYLSSRTPGYDFLCCGTNVTRISEEAVHDETTKPSRLETLVARRSRSRRAAIPIVLED